MDDLGNLHSVWMRTIENHKRTNDERSNACPEVLPRLAEQRLPGKNRKRLKQSLDLTSRGRGIAFFDSDVVPMPSRSRRTSLSRMKRLMALLGLPRSVAGRRAWMSSKNARKAASSSQVECLSLIETIETPLQLGLEPAQILAVLMKQPHCFQQQFVLRCVTAESELLTHELLQFCEKE